MYYLYILLNKKQNNVNITFKYKVIIIMFIYISIDAYYSQLLNQKYNVNLTLLLH